MTKCCLLISCKVYMEFVCKSSDWPGL